MTREEYANRPGRSSKWITPLRRLSLYLRDGFTCLYCGRDLHGAPAHDVHLDHLRPRNAGGTDEDRNLITACRSCNCARQDRPWTEYATAGARERIERHRRRKPNRALAKEILAGRAPRRAPGRGVRGGDEG